MSIHIRIQILLLLCFAFHSSSFGQTSQQLQVADAELNKAYQELKGTLNAVQKEQLKVAQRDWIKKRDAYVASNPNNPKAALFEATTEGNFFPLEFKK